jgi:hypothetical protein
MKQNYFSNRGKYFNLNEHFFLDLFAFKLLKNEFFHFSSLETMKINAKKYLCPLEGQSECSESELFRIKTEYELTWEMLDQIIDK